MYLIDRIIGAAIVSTAFALACVDDNINDNKCDTWYCGQCGQSWGYCDQEACVRPLDYIGWPRTNEDVVRIESSCSDYRVGGNVEECRGWFEPIDCYGGWGCVRCFRDVCVEAMYTSECHGGIDTED